MTSKKQSVVPVEALGVSPDDKLLVVRGQTVVILPRPRSFAKALRGLAKQAYPEGYLTEERASWSRTPTA